MRFPALVLVLLLCACEPTTDPNTCSLSNCTGCCDRNGLCQPGLLPNACGSFGNACDVCVGIQQCAVGRCAAPSAGGAGGGTATGGGAATGGVTSTGGGAATGGGTSTGGGSATGGGTATGGGSATGGGGGATVTCTGGCSHFTPSWNASPMTQPPYGSGGSRVTFIDNTTFVASLGVLSTLSGGAPFVSDGKIYVYDTQGLQLRQLTQLSRTTVSLAVSPDGSTVAAGSMAGGVLQVVPTAGGTVTELGYGVSVDALAFSPDGRSLYAGGTQSYFGDTPVARFDLVSGQSIRSMALNSWSVGIVPAANGTTLSVASDGSGQYSRRLLTTMRASDLSSQGSAPSVFTIYKRDPRTGQAFWATDNMVMGVAVPGPRIVAAAPHPTLAKAITLQYGGMLRLIDLPRGRVEDEVRANLTAYDVAISPDCGRSSRSA